MSHYSGVRLLTFSFLLVFLSCKKESTELKSYMRYRIAGENRSFDTCYVTIMGKMAGASSVYYCSIASGRPGNAGLILTVFNNKDIEAKVYTETEIDEVKVMAASIGGYKDADGRLYISNQTGWPLEAVKVEITERKSQYMKGSFSGSIRTEGINKLNITDGEFLALIK